MQTKKNIFERKGSLVTYHREKHLVPCPCLTPEGFRDPIFHRDWVERGLASVAIVNQGTLFPANTTNIKYWFFLNAGTANVPIPVGLSNIYNSSFSETQSFGLSFQWSRFMGSQPNGVVVFRQVTTGAILGPLENLGVQFSDASNKWLDAVPLLGGTTVTFVDPDIQFPTCNQLGFVPDKIEILLRAFVQPQWGARRTRQYLLEAFGELRTDDHIGMFPISWKGYILDFENWSDAGDEWVEYAGQRFTVVGWTLIPDPRAIDHGPHHWEVVLRRIKTDVAIPAVV